jgi:excinuclease ABC subunit B
MQTTRSVRPFEVVSEYAPSGDQPQAIAELAARINAGETDVVLLGATGTGKSATTAWLIEQVQRPTLVLAHNKTLAAQLANEFRELMPNNAVEYFVSYYDYYQPEAYVRRRTPSSRRTRRSTPRSSAAPLDDELAAEPSRRRRGLDGVVHLRPRRARGVPARDGRAAGGRAVRPRRAHPQVHRDAVQPQRRRLLARQLPCAATRSRSSPSTRSAIRIELFGDEIEALYMLHPLTGEVCRSSTACRSSRHALRRGHRRVQRAIGTIEDELAERLAELERQGKLLEAQRLRMRTTFDLEMMQQLGFCSGIENYSRHIDGREPGEPPHTLLDFFPDDFLLVIDESHVTVPQIGAMYEGDASRKRTLVEHGFRLPSALDNRPLRWDEFKSGSGRRSTCRPRRAVRDGHRRRRRRADHPPDRPRRSADRREAVEGADRRPAGGDPPARRARRARAGHHAHEEDGRGAHRLPRRARVACATCTPTSTRCAASNCSPSCARRLRRAGRHQPAPRGPRPARGVAGRDPRRRQGGFLRSGTSLIQTIGRAARNVRRGAHVRRQHDRLDANAIEETERRREKQIAYNTANGIDPQPLRKKIADITDVLAREGADTAELLAKRTKSGRGKSPTPNLRREGIAAEGAVQLEATIADLSRRCSRRRASSSSSSRRDCATRCRT